MVAVKEHEYCLRCGRKLKTPETRLKGYGSVCEKKMKTTRLHKLFTVNKSCKT